ncbi:MAG: NAD(P) transhydrogenase subunit alpha [Pirellulaceae bacterium]|nr:NAD(P) transhydrogenase subunit alpha [Pirellulaceae bacterium]
MKPYSKFVKAQSGQLARHSLLLLGCLFLVAASPSVVAKDSAAPAAVAVAGQEDQTVEASPAVATSRHEAGVSRGAKLVASFTVFLLAVFVGFEVITKVPPTLHTPLMSGSNAISGITVIGAILTAGHVAGGWGSFLGMLAVVLAMLNVAGGFLVTRRMLVMFKKR